MVQAAGGLAETDRSVLSPEFLFNGSEVGPENLHAYRVPRCCRVPSPRNTF